MSYQFFFQEKKFPIFLIVWFWINCTNVFWQAIFLMTIAVIDMGKVQLYPTVTCLDDTKIVGRVCSQLVDFVLKIINNLFQVTERLISQKKFFREYRINFKMQNSVKLHFSSLATSFRENALTCSFNCFSHNRQNLIRKRDEVLESVLHILN